MANPLDQFVSAGPASNDVKVRSMPKLSEFVREHGFKSGVAKFDEAMEQWRQQHERTLNERLQGKAAGVSAGNV